MRSTRRCCLSNEEMRCARLNPLASGARGRIPRPPDSSTWLLKAEAAEDGERIAGFGFQNHFSACLDLAVEPGCECVGVLPARGADDQVAEPALGLVPLGLELLRKLIRL